MTNICMHIHNIPTWWSDAYSVQPGYQYAISLVWGTSEKAKSLWIKGVTKDVIIFVHSCIKSIADNLPSNCSTF